MSRSTLRKIRSDLDFAVMISGRMVARGPDGRVLAGECPDDAEDIKGWTHEEVLSGGEQLFTLEGPQTTVHAAADYLRHRLSETAATRNLRQELLRNYKQILRFEEFAVEISSQTSVAAACRILNESAKGLVEADASLLLVRSRGGEAPRIIHFDDGGRSHRVDDDPPVPANRWEQLDDPIVISRSRICVPVLVGSTRPALLVVDRDGQDDWSAGDVNILGALGKLGSAIIPGIANRVSQQRLVGVRAKREAKVVAKAIRDCVHSNEDSSATLSMLLMRQPRNLDLDPNAIPQGDQYRLLFIETLLDAGHQVVFMEDGGVLGLNVADAEDHEGDHSASSVVQRFATMSESLGLDLAPGGVAALDPVSTAEARVRPEEVWQELNRLQRELSDGAFVVQSFSTSTPTDA